MDCFKKTSFAALMTSAVTVVKENIKELVKLILVPISISFILQIGMSVAFQNKSQAFPIYFILCILIDCFIHILMIRVLSLIVLEREWSNHSVYKDILSYPFGEISGTIGLFLVIFLVGPLLAFLTKQIGFCLLSIAVGTYAVFFLPITVLKRVYYSSPIIDSYNLVVNQWWRVFGFCVLSVGILYLGHIALSTVISGIVSVLPQFLQSILLALSFLFITIILGLIEHSFRILLFFSIRGEREGYTGKDLECELFEKNDDVLLIP